MKEQIKRHLSGHVAAIKIVEEQLAEPIERCAQLLADVLAAGNKVILLGNGGSAADAQHFAAELVGRFLRERRALPAVALTADGSILTAVGNDYGFGAIFSRQVEALAMRGDVVIGISTSGCSVNVKNALEQARERGCHTVALLGRDGGIIAPLVDLPLVVMIQETPFIQEAHAMIIHILCDLVEITLFPPSDVTKQGLSV